MGSACSGPAAAAPVPTEADAAEAETEHVQTERVVVKIVSSMQHRMSWWRRWHLVVDPKGAVIHGLNMRSHCVDIGQEYEDFVGYEIPRMPLLDPSASQLLITKADGKFWMVPPPEKFTRHFGAAVIIGDRQHSSDPYEMQVGDVIRLGSVGLVVIESCSHDGIVERLAEEELQFLRDCADELKSIVFDEDATTARQEKEQKRAAELSAKGNEKEALDDGDNATTCYMCFESEETPENPLIAPCDCLGDTRYVHVQCLQKWNGIGEDEGSSVVCTTQGPAVCKVCKRRYKLRLKTDEGQAVPLLYKTLPPPYVCFLVVTKHDNCPHLFGAQYQVSPVRTGRVRQGDKGVENPYALIGRSHQCDMIVNYRTVSTQHARVYYDKERRKFFLEDLRSSNGTSLFLKRPVEVPSERAIKLRLGRTTMLVRTQHGWSVFKSLSRQNVPALESNKSSQSLTGNVIPNSENPVEPSPEKTSDNSSKSRNQLSSSDRRAPTVTLEFLKSLCSLDNTSRRLVGRDLANHQTPSARSRRHIAREDREHSERHPHSAAVEDVAVDDHPRGAHRVGHHHARFDVETVSSNLSSPNVSDIRRAQGRRTHGHRRATHPRRINLDEIEEPVREEQRIGSDGDNLRTFGTRQLDVWPLSEGEMEPTTIQETQLEAYASSA